MNLGRWLRVLYEEQMRIKRDRLYLRKVAIAEEVFRGTAWERRMGDLYSAHQDIHYLLEDLGIIPLDIHDCILEEKNTETLRRWLKAAARAESYDAFRERMN